MNPMDVVRVIFARISGGEVDAAMEIVLFRLRVPRALASILIGAALSVSGAAYQSALRNPLVSPDLLGVSAGATVGAAVAIYFGLPLISLQIFAFGGGMLAVVLATTLPKIMRNSTSMMLVLSGIIVSGLMNSILGIIKLLSRETDQLSSIVFWQMGSLAQINSTQLAAIAPPILIGLAGMISISWRMNILSFGEQEAKTVGVNVLKLRGIIIVCASLLTACSVSISGTIGWIGLIIPHFGRLICGSDNTKLLPVTALLGGSFLLVIDTIARTATTLEIPLSILSGLVGAPLYAWLLYRQRARVI